MKKITTEEFILRSKMIHGDKYDYSLVDYKNMKTKVKIIYHDWIFEQKAEDHLLGKLCELRWDTDRFINESIKIHGNKYDYTKTIFINMKTNVIIILDNKEYHQTPEKHLMGRCPEKVRKLKTTNEFIEDSRKVWGYKYDYSLVDYKGSYTEVIIKFKGKEYLQTPSQHLSGYKCEKANIKNTSDFIKKSIEKYGNKYDYSLVEYKGIQENVKILYNGIVYEQKASNHLYSSGLIENSTKIKTNGQFILESNQVHDNNFSYEKTKYINNHKKVIITCPTHGDFKQTPKSHIDGLGCPNCIETKGVKKIANFLTENNILFESQKKFEDCRNILPLPFDFYIKDFRTCIEFDGVQHFTHGLIDNFNTLKINDKIKNDYCEDNYINLIRIKYNQIEDIEYILEKSLSSYK